MNVNAVYEIDSRICFYKYKLTVRHYENLDKTKYTNKDYYVDETGAHEWEVHLIPKHQLLELISKTELDTSEYAWMEGIELQTQDTAKEIAKIAAYGSLEAYQASLQETRDEYLLDLECRVSMMELGLNE